MCKTMAMMGTVMLLGMVGLAASPDLTGREKAKIKARPFDLKQVRLLDGPFKDAMERDRAYLHAIEPDRLLHMFRVTAGLPSSAKPYGGWEEPKCELRGHSMGHYLSACALMYASTGDEKLKAKADAIVAELAKCQKALGSGYLSAYPEGFIDRVEATQRVWAPYYTLHKIYTGLLEMYVHCGNKQALEVAEGMAAWNKKRLDRLDADKMEAILNRTEQGGMNEALANLYALTGKPDYLAMARRFDEKHYVDPLANGEDRLKGEHVNSFIPNMIGSARQYELTGNERDRRIAEFFWDQVTGKRCYATGGTSNFEGWRTEPNQLAAELSDRTQETCCSYNMLKLTRHLFTWNPDARYADYYERTLYNAILSTQNPKDGMVMYYVPLAAGYKKTFCSPWDSFWCCTGTGMENHAKYGDSIYFHGDDELFVNLFIASELDWQDKGVRIRQETNFPEEESTALIIKTAKPVELALHIRVPYWATRGVAVKINGKEEAVNATPASYLTLKRSWKDGDRIEAALPMSFHLHRMPDDANLAAIMYGPLVLAGELGAAEPSSPGVSLANPPSQRVDPSAVVSNLVVEKEDLSAWIKPVADKPLTFRTTNAGRPKDVTLVAFHKLFDQRYTIYWRLHRTDAEWRAVEARRTAMAAEDAARRKRLEGRIVDNVNIGDARSEKQHNLQGDKTGAGTYMGRRWRHAPDGWFSYDLKVQPDQPMTLLCTWWGDESGERTFDILIDDTKIATLTLLHNKPQKFFDAEYKISPERTKDKQKVTVKFQAHPGNTAGGVFGCAMLKQGKNE